MLKLLITLYLILAALTSQAATLTLNKQQIKLPSTLQDGKQYHYGKYTAVHSKQMHRLSVIKGKDFVDIYWVAPYKVTGKPIKTKIGSVIYTVRRSPGTTSITYIYNYTTKIDGVVYTLAQTAEGKAVPALLKTMIKSLKTEKPKVTQMGCMLLAVYL